MSARSVTLPPLPLLELGMRRCGVGAGSESRIWEFRNLDLGWGFGGTGGVIGGETEGTKL
jgi:hypothetical protein